MKALITGVTGFAGQHLASHLLDCGDAVLGVSTDGGWGENRDSWLAGEVPLVTWDIRHEISEDATSRIRTFAPDTIFHLAALSIPALCGDGEPTPDAIATNVEGTRRVCLLAEQLDSPPRVVFISSGRVYGDVTFDAPMVTEQSPTAPVTSYAKTKLQAEQIVQFHGQRGLPYIIARAFNHTGPRQQPPLMLPQWCEQLARGATVLSIRNGNVSMDLSDVRDVVGAYRMLAVDAPAGEIYNVGSGQAVKTGEIANELLRIASIDANLQSESDRAQQNAIADITKLTQQTMWRPRVSLPDTIARTWEYWVEQIGGKS